MNKQRKDLVLKSIMFTLLPLLFTLPLLLIPDDYLILNIAPLTILWGMVFAYSIAKDI